MTTLITASMLYKLVHCPHRPHLDLFGDLAQRDEPNAFVQLLWERGSLYEKEIIEGLDIPYTDLSVCSPREKEERTREAMERGAPLIYGGRIAAEDLLKARTCLQRFEICCQVGFGKLGADERQVQ